jgi:hypothetical protein
VKALLFACFLCFSWILLNGFSSESDLSKLMRLMTSDAKKLREKVQQGDKIPMFYKKYKRIYTAKASADGKKGSEFDGLAAAFLINCERLQNADNASRKGAYNAMVIACIRCHEKYCPGPINMLKKLQLP